MDQKTLRLIKKIASSRYKFIKDLKIEDDTFKSTIFLKAKVDFNEMIEYIGIEYKYDLNSELSYNLADLIGNFDNDMLLKLKRLNLQIIDFFDDMSKHLIPNEIKPFKFISVFKFLGVNNEDFDS